MTLLKPGDVIGILGAGQLGRMLAMSAAQLGFDVHVYTDKENSPAARVAARATVAPYDDLAALREFARHARVVTTEFENVPAPAAAALEEAGVAVRPNPRALAIAQDRFEEKTYLQKHKLETAKFARVESAAHLTRCLDMVGTPAILKTRRMGYDGHGQFRISHMRQAVEAWTWVQGELSIVESFCAFEKEVSLIAARGVDGSFAAYDLCENEHKDGILSRTLAPASVSPETTEKARADAQRLMEALDYVGVLTIEFFLMPDGRLIANEIAPRVHNSGHWTMEAALTSQFEQHIRAIAGWPLGPTDRICDAEMINLIGADADDWEKLAADPDARLHLYGKGEARPRRKMGHVTKLKR